MLVLCSALSNLCVCAGLHTLWFKRNIRSNQYIMICTIMYKQQTIADHYLHRNVTMSESWRETFSVCWFNINIHFNEANFLGKKILIYCCEMTAWIFNPSFLNVSNPACSYCTQYTYQLSASCQLADSQESLYFSQISISDLGKFKIT